MPRRKCAKAYLICQKGTKMGKTGISLEDVKRKNKSTIIQLLNDQGPMSRKDISQNVSLTPAAVTMLCSEMIEEKILVEKGEVAEEKKVGRKKVHVDINYHYKCIVAVSIEQKWTYISICDLKGRVLAEKRIVTDRAIPPEEFLKQTATECKALLWESGNSQEDILGAGICIPGIVDKKQGVSIHAYGIWKETVQVKASIQEKMNCPVIVETNVKAFAEGELLYGFGKKEDNLLFVKWGPGVGSAMIIGNQLYEGHGYKAAEIGHYIIEPDGLPCRCGRRGCLETKVSIPAIVNRLQEIYSKEETPRLYELTDGDPGGITEESFTEWIEGAEGLPDILSDSAVADILGHNIERLARAVVNVMTMLAPDHTIIFGSMLDNAYIEQAFLRDCRKYDPSYTEEYIGRSLLSRQIHSIGPTAITAKELFF